MKLTEAPDHATHGPAREERKAQVTCSSCKLPMWRLYNPEVNEDWACPFCRARRVVKLFGVVSPIQINAVISAEDK